MHFFMKPTKSSLVINSLKPFQGGTRQQLGKNNTTAPSPAGHNAKNVVMINSQTNLNILGGKPLQVAVTNAVMEIDKPILTEPIEEAKDITSLTEDTLPPPDAQAPAVHEEKPPMLTMDHPVIANHGPAAKFVLKKEKPQTVRIVQSMLKVEDKKVKEVAPPITKETITKHEQSNSPNNSTVKNSIFDDDSTLCDDQSVQSSLQSISSMGHAEQKSKVLNAHGHHASKKSGRPPSPQHVAPYVLPRKPQAVALDLPDQKSLINQKHAAMLAKNLSQRGVSIDQSPLQKIIFKHEKRERKSIAARDHDEDDFEESVDTDDESLVDGYFDRNAKPIFVERKNRIKSTQKPKSKRQGVVTEVDDTDDYSNLQDNSLDLFMDSLDEDDRKMLANMSEEDRKKLISELNVSLTIELRKRILIYILYGFSFLIGDKKERTNQYQVVKIFD